MFDLNELSLNALLKIASEACLVKRYRMTEWVVVLEMRGRELVMNHGNARIFLQGIIYGAAAMTDKEKGVQAEVSHASRLAVG